MEIQEIITFLNVAQHGSFSHAARHLGYSQAAVTVHIKNLEKELKVRLFDRLGKTTSLTSHGKIFYEHALKIVNDMQKAKDAVRQDEELSGSLHIGTIDSLCSSLLPRILLEYHKLYPKVSVSVTTDTPKALLNMLHGNELDVVYLIDEKRMENWICKVLEKEIKVVFAAVSEHPLADQKPHSITELLDFPFILTEKDASYRKVLDYRLQMKNMEIQPLFQSNNTDLLLHMVREQLGITFLPEYTLQKDRETGILHEILVPDLQIHVWQQVIHHKDKWITREMKAFFNLYSLSSSSLSS